MNISIRNDFFGILKSLGYFFGAGDTLLRSKITWKGSGHEQTDMVLRGGDHPFDRSGGNDGVISRFNAKIGFPGGGSGDGGK